ncbi:MAG: redoxin domain-containing protein [Ruminococcaceae bacterium]|nr:redoxin domain-containing protein [Oscillospiraceae bacterium]
MSNRGKGKRIISVFLALTVFLSSAFIMCSNVAALTLGDVNSDGSINSVDANLLKRFLSGSIVIDNATEVIDIDGDGVVNAIDSSLLIRIISGTYTPERNEPVAPDITVYDADGNAVRLSDFKGKPVILNFWASWCTPCKKEMPDFNEKYLEYGDEIQFLMIDFAKDDNIEDAKAYVAEMGFAFPVYFDTYGDAAKTYGVIGFPTTVFIDSDGYIMDSYRGTISEETLLSGINKILD